MLAAPKARAPRRHDPVPPPLCWKSCTALVPVTRLILRWRALAAMEDAALAALHTQLASAEAARGAHGGLGFSKPLKGEGKAKRDNDTEATRTLLNDKGGGKNREFHTTTAGAVAAGHWDPWSRPVAFKMKEVNRRVGGLYSMFVKGGTVGSVLDDTPSASASASASAPAPAPAPAPVPSSAAAATFNWKRIIKEQLRNAEGQQLKIKRLRKVVLAEYARRTTAAQGDKDEARRLFRRKLKRMPGVTVEAKLVRLGSK